MNPALSVENLSKVFRVEVANQRNGRGGWRHALHDVLRTPLHRLKHGAGHGLHTEEFWALRDVSFEVQRGEVLGIIGRNGAGKSTLLKILSRITGPTSGQATIEGRVGSLLEVGTGFHPDLSGRDNVYLNGAILGMSHREIRRHFDDIVDFSGVGSFIDVPVKRYSSGMRVRLGFGVAAFLQPEILIVDEVLAVGDAEFQRRCLGKMSEVAQGGRTVLFVSHNMGAIGQLTERCVLLENGGVAIDGPTPRTVDRYLRLQFSQSSGTITAQMHKICRGVRFRCVQMHNSEGRATNSPANFSPIHVIIDFEVQEPMKDLVVSLGIDTIDGTCVARFSTNAPLFGAHQLGPGTYQIGLELELPLNPGSYQVMVRADRGMRQASQLAVVGNAMIFTLVESRQLGFDAAPKPFREPLLPLIGRWYEP